MINKESKANRAVQSLLLADPFDAYCFWTSQFRSIHTGQKIMSKGHVSEKLFSVLQCTHSCMPLRNLWGLPLVWLIALIKLPTSFRIVKAVFTLYKIAFAPARKPHRVGDLFTQVKRSGFGAIFVTERSCTTLHLSQNRVTYRTGVHFSWDGDTCNQEGGWRDKRVESLTVQYLRV